MEKGNSPKCTGNCMNCSVIQRQFCSSQIAYNNMKVLESIVKELSDMKEKVEQMQNEESVLISPTADTAQKGDGAGK